MCSNIKDLKRHFDSWRDSFLVGMFSCQYFKKVLVICGWRCLIISESAVLLESSDDKWLSNIENSRWLAGCQQCLDTVRKVVEIMVGEQAASVLLKGTLIYLLFF